MSRLNGIENLTVAVLKILSKPHLEDPGVLYRKNQIQFKVWGITHSIYLSWYGPEYRLAIQVADKKSLPHPLTRDYLTVYATAHGFLASPLHRDLDNFLEGLELEGDIRIEDCTFSMKETEWEAWFREFFVGTGFFEKHFNSQNVHVIHVDRDFFKVYYGEDLRLCARTMVTQPYLLLGKSYEPFMSDSGYVEEHLFKHAMEVFRRCLKIFMQPDRAP